VHKHSPSSLFSIPLLLNSVKHFHSVEILCAENWNVFEVRCLKIMHGVKFMITFRYHFPMRSEKVIRGLIQSWEE